MNDITVEELERVRIAAAAHAEGLASVLVPMLERITAPKPPTPEEFRKHWRYVFAAQAMTGLMSSGDPQAVQMSESKLADIAVTYADAMLVELDRTP